MLKGCTGFSRYHPAQEATVLDKLSDVHYVQGT